MNRLQIARQAQLILRSLTWPDAGTPPVFASDSVMVTMGSTEKGMTEKRFPLAFVRPGSASPDPEMSEERPDLVQIEYTITLAVANAQDQTGETSLVGSNRLGGSDGRGLLEVEEKVQAALFQLGPASGFRPIFRGSSIMEPKLFETLGYVVFGDYRFRSMGTLSRTYQAPSGFTNTGTAFTWNASPRWDARRFILRRASGLTPPATSASGTGITLGGSPDGAGVTSKTDTPGSGTWSYSLFLAYDDVDGSADAAVSAAQTISGIVVP